MRVYNLFPSRFFFYYCFDKIDEFYFGSRGHLVPSKFGHSILRERPLSENSYGATDTRRHSLNTDTLVISKVQPACVYTRFLTLFLHPNRRLQRVEASFLYGFV